MQTHIWMIYIYTLFSLTTITSSNRMDCPTKENISSVCSIKASASEIQWKLPRVCKMMRHHNYQGRLIWEQFLEDVCL